MGWRLVAVLLVLLASGQARAQDQAQAGVTASSDALVETIVDVRVHGNHTTPDEDVLAIAGLRPGHRVVPSLLADSEARLLASGRFDHAEARKRYASLDDASQVLIVLVVSERAGVSIDVPSPGPLRQLKASTMWLPVLEYEDGYGLTYGVRLALVDLLGKRTRVAAPLTWGGERRLAVEVEQRFESGPLTRLVATASISRRENPAYDVGERRDTLDLRLARVVTSWLRLGATARSSSVRFGTLSDRVRAVGLDARIDTRTDPTFPRNAVFAAAEVERLWFEEAPDTFRTRLDVRGYAAAVGQSVVVIRARLDRTAGPVPAYEDSLLGGAESVRGYRAGHRADDRLATGSLELRVPLTSPLSVGRAGVAIFTDTGAVYPARDSLRSARFDTVVGAGVFMSATLFHARLDVARRTGGGARVLFGMGLTF